MYNFSAKELSQINNKGLNIDKINTQLLRFKEGFPFSNLEAPATIKNGIKKLSENELKSNISSYNKLKNEKKIVKFVPASGAASRMFKFLFEFYNELDNNKFENIINKNKDAKTFFDNIQQFPFYKQLSSLSTLECNDDKYPQEIINNLLEKEGLNYAKLPKAFIKFHNYKSDSRFAIEEHLAEAAEYACSNNNEANIHFTVSEDHKELFKKNLKELISQYNNKYEITYNIDLSIQKPSTDTIAVDLDNNPYKNNEGNLVFRPAGHGALIENLNEIDADLIFIKNIDNVVTDSKRQITTDYKKALGGIGLKLHNNISLAINSIITNKNFKGAENIITIDLEQKLPIKYPSYTNNEKHNYLIEKLNRPIRICGMVKNEGEPGGGPFWVNKSGEKSLQIVEGSEIDINIESQKNIVNNASHFNPVDLICITKDFKGNKIDLKEFIDYNAGFISEKSINGDKVKAMELPGLWNGAMSMWNTIFVEVPIETFNPVKTVNDLLREMHQ